MELSRNKLTGRLGTNYVEEVALKAGCKPILIPEDLDTGIDGFIEFAHSQTTLGKMVAFQVKRGGSFFRQNQPRVQTDKRHLLYWKNFCIPVLLIVVNEDGSEGYWMDVQQHIQSNPELVESGPYVLYPPLTQPFSVSTLTSVIAPLGARHLMFGDVVSALCSSNMGDRLSGLSLAYPFRAERKAVFTLTSALCFETEQDAIHRLCDFLSRYLCHPEMSFSVPQGTCEYAEQLLGQLTDTHLLRILESFETEELSFDYALEVHKLEPEEIWVRSDMFERGSVQQSMAVVVQAIADEKRLLSILNDRSVNTMARRAAVALFGYLGYTCESTALDRMMHDEQDAILAGLLSWLKFWIEEEEAEDSQ